MVLTYMRECLAFHSAGTSVSIVRSSSVQADTNQKNELSVQRLRSKADFLLIRRKALEHVRRNMPIIQPPVDKADQETFKGDFTTALFNAARNGDTQMANILLDRGAMINLRNGDGGDTALTIASEEGNDRMVELLPERGALIDKTSMSGDTALNIACCAGNESTARLLLEKGADPSYLTLVLEDHWLNNSSELAKKLLLEIVEERNQPSRSDDSLSINSKNRIDAARLTNVERSGSICFCEVAKGEKIYVKSVLLAIQYFGDGEKTSMRVTCSCTRLGLIKLDSQHDARLWSQQLHWEKEKAKKHGLVHRDRQLGPIETYEAHHTWRVRAGGATALYSGRGSQFFFFIKRKEDVSM